jgi:hypothetical protein
VTKGILFWVLMILWLVFGLWVAYPVGTLMGFNALLFILLGLLGWAVFGPAIQG